MKKLLAIALVISIASCSKQTTNNKAPLTPEVRQQMINAALNTVNDNRIVIANKILLAYPAPKGASLKEIIATNKATGQKSFGYIVIEAASRAPSPDGWGTYTGWLLEVDCCFHHGTFFWSGDPSNAVFVEDKNPYGDNYIGNEPRCMSDDSMEQYC